MLKKLIVENILKGRKTKPLTNAIIKRHPITFYYSDSNTDKNSEDRVKSGVRVRAEMVALGLSKKGNVIARGYVEPPSVSKKGYGESGWRTFRVDRMSNIKIIDDETFDNKRSKYKEGDESKSGPMDITYVTSDWGITKDGEKDLDQQPQEPELDVSNTPNEPEQNDNPEPEITSNEPQPSDSDNDGNLPEPENKVPSENPMGDDSVEVSDGNTDISLNDVEYFEKDGQKFITQNDYDNLVSNLYKNKENVWREKQIATGNNTRPGQGTRKKFEYDSSVTVSDFLRKNDLKINNGTELNENILRIKSLML